jgi:signal transduction histidine kinase/CheY-like chemotaxis protein
MNERNSNDMIIMINECFEHLSNIKNININELLNFNLTKICNFINCDYGLIGELQNNLKNEKFIRYYGMYGFDVNNYTKSYDKNGYCDFIPNDFFHDKVIETKKYVVCNNISEYSKYIKTENCQLINTFCSFPLLKNNNVIGVIAFARKDKVNFTGSEIKKLEPFTKFISNVLINIRNMEEIEHHKMSFIANMSHEVRTPLNAIITMIEMLMNTNLNSKQYDYVDTIKTCGIQLMDILNDILDFSKIINNGIKLKMAPMSINKCISSVHSMLLQKANEKDLKFDFVISNDVPDMLIGDLIRIKQVLMNIISNSIKFTKKGSVNIIVNSKSLNENECELSIKIKDTGIGIPDDKIDKVFDSFRQIENDYLSDICGVGLGLAISKHIVELYKGNISIESKINIGTTINIKIPFHIFKETLDMDILQKYFTNKNVLIYHKEVQERISLFSMMSEYNIKPILTSSIDETIMYLTNNNFNFEFILLNMNDLSSDDIFKIQRVKNATIKVIILDITSHENKILSYDYKLLRPIDKTKISYLLNLIFTSNQYNVAKIHNEIMINNNLHKISNVNPDCDKIITDVNKNIKILVAEDNKQNQKVMLELLNSIGYNNIVLTEDGLETYNKLVNDTFDIAFVDLKMPIMSGITAVVKYKEKCDKSTVIIAVTASLSNDVKKQCYDAGMNGFIAKPIDKKDLETIMELIFGSKK